MDNQKFVKLMFQAPLPGQESYAASERDPITGPPNIPPPRAPLGQPWDNRREPDDPVLPSDIFLILLAIALWSFVGFAILEKFS